ncbi:MAG: phosphoserine phosphatase SerB [Promethearchaeota archaeon]
MGQTNREPLPDEAGTFYAVSAYGRDAPGLVAEITGAIAARGANIVDIEQSCRRGVFTIFLVVDATNVDVPVEQFVAELEALPERTGLRVDVAPLERGRRKVEVKRVLVTSLGHDRPGILAAVSSFYRDRGVNIEQTRMIARGEFFSMEMLLDVSDLDVPFEEFRRQLQHVHADVGLSIVVQSEETYHRAKKLVVFDVEHSILGEEYALEVARALGAEVTKGTAADGTRPPEGATKVDPAEEVRARARLLRGLRAEDVDGVTRRMSLAPGTVELLGALKAMGFKIALISSGFNQITKKLFEQAPAGVDYAFANDLVVDSEGRFTGEVAEPIIDDAKKTELLEFIADVEGLSKEEIVAIGDGVNDRGLMHQCGLSIAFRPDVAEALVADGVVTSNDLMSLLYCFGLPASELEKVKGKEERR